MVLINTEEMECLVLVCHYASIIYIKPFPTSYYLTLFNRKVSRLKEDWHFSGCFIFIVLFPLAQLLPLT